MIRNAHDELLAYNFGICGGSDRSRLDEVPDLTSAKGLLLTDLLSRYA